MPFLVGIFRPHIPWFVPKIRYHDGTEELYDHENDPDEFTNLAAREEYAQIKEEMATWLPKVNRPPIQN